MQGTRRNGFGTIFANANNSVGDLVCYFPSQPKRHLIERIHCSWLIHPSPWADRVTGAIQYNVISIFDGTIPEGQSLFVPNTLTFAGDVKNLRFISSLTGSDGIAFERQFDLDLIIESGKDFSVALGTPLSINNVSGVSSSDLSSRTLTVLGHIIPDEREQQFALR